MHVAVVDPDVSYPPTSGKRLRTLNLMLKLADRHRITYLARAGEVNNDTQAAEAFLKQHGIRPVIVHDPLPTRRGLRFYGRLLGNLGAKCPYSVAVHQSPKLEEAILRCAAESPVDVWQFEWSSYLMRLAGRLPGPKVLMAHNVDSLIWQRYYEVETNPLRKWYIGRQWAKFRQFERTAFQQATRVVAVSDNDARLMQSEFGAHHVDVVDNGVDCDFFGQHTSQRHPRQILFLGALDWRPNQDGLRFLLDDIWPLIVPRLPDARLTIVGRQPPEWLLDRVQSDARVTLHANVADVRPYLASSALMVVPLRIGGGSRLKILEALASGLPVVSTRVGAEGLAIEPGQHWSEGNSASEFADAVIQGLQDPVSLQAQASAGREIVRRQYDWGTLADRLDAIWKNCATQAPSLSAEPAGRNAT